MKSFRKGVCWACGGSGKTWVNGHLLICGGCGGTGKV
jgi:hypothetical protein